MPLLPEESSSGLAVWPFVKSKGTRACGRGCWHCLRRLAQALALCGRKKGGSASCQSA